MKPVVAVGEHLVIDPQVCHGQMTFKGTRVPVETVLLYLAKGETFDELQAGWPRVSREAITVAVRLATVALLEKYP